MGREVEEHRGDAAWPGVKRTRLSAMLCAADVSAARCVTGTLESARTDLWGHSEVTNYATRHEHRHSALGLMTPHDLHYGLAQAKWRQRAAVRRAAYDAHPERFPRGVSVPPPLPTAAWINKPLVAPAPR
jgi:hypothetical protein